MPRAVGITPCLGLWPSRDCGLHPCVRGPALGPEISTWTWRCQAPGLSGFQVSPGGAGACCPTAAWRPTLFLYLPPHLWSAALFSLSPGSWRSWTSGVPGQLCWPVVRPGAGACVTQAGPHSFWVSSLALASPEPAGRGTSSQAPGSPASLVCIGPLCSPSSSAGEGALCRGSDL